MENKPQFRFGFMIVLCIIVLAGQYISTGYLEKQFQTRLQNCYETINQSTLLMTALINKLEEKNILTKKEILDEAQTLSSDLKQLVEKINAEKGKTPSEPTPYSR